MKTSMLMFVLCLVAVGVKAGIFDDQDIIKRGDANHSGGVNLTDAVYLNSYLFSGGPAPPCMNEADVNHDGTVNGADSSYILNWLFNGGPAPPAPGPTNTTCTHSTTPYITCNAGC